MKFQKIWQSLDFRNNKVINAKTDLPTHEDHIVPQKYVDSKTIYNTQKVLDYINPFKLDWVKNPVNKSFLDLFDEIFFPRILPIYNNPKFNSISIKNENSPIIFINTTNTGFVVKYDISESDRFLNQVPKIVITYTNNSVFNINMDSTSLVGEKHFNIDWTNIQKIEFVAIFNPTTITKQDTYGDDYTPEEFETIYELKHNLLLELQSNFTIVPAMFYRKIQTNEDLELIVNQTTLINSSQVLINSLNYIKTNKTIVVTPGIENFFILLLPKILYDEYLLFIGGDNIPKDVLTRNTLMTIDGVQFYLNTLDLGYYENQTILEIFFKFKADTLDSMLLENYYLINDLGKIDPDYLDIVDNLTEGGSNKILSAEQGKILQTQVSAINTLLTSDNINLDTVQELVDAIETVQMSLSTILVNDLTTGGSTKALTAEMGKQLDLIKESTANKSTSFVVDYLSNIKFPSVKAVYDFCISTFKKKFLAFGDVSGIAHTFGAGSENTMFKFSNNNPITATIPTNATTPLEIGTVFETIAIGNGALTVTGAPGVTILTNLSNTSVKNEVRRYTKIDTDTWSVEGVEVTLTSAQTFSSGLKTFLNGTLGLRNVANTFTSFFTNAATASRTWTFPDKNGTVAMTSDLPTNTVATGNQNRMLKYTNAGGTQAGNSRIEDTGTCIGFDTVNPPTKEITLSNKREIEVGIENSNSITKGRDLRVKAGSTINFLENPNLQKTNQGALEYISMDRDNQGNIYFSLYDGTSSSLWKKINDTGLFEAQIGSPSRVTAVARKSNGDVYVCASDFINDIYVQIGGVGSFSRLNVNQKFGGIAVLQNGDVYAGAGGSSYGGVTPGDIYKQTGGTGSFVALGLQPRGYTGLATGLNNDCYACVLGGDIYKLTSGTGSFVALGAGNRNWGGITVDINGDVYACVSGGDIYKQTGGIGLFSPLNQQSRGYNGVVISNNRNLYACVTGDDIYSVNVDSIGLPDLDGGTHEIIAGTGKGTGKSRVEFYTGQKTVSGTDMQVETLREYIDENGYHVYTSMPVYADNAAAVAGGLPIGCEYRTATGVKMIVY